MALTVSEKQHWKERIARKISQAVEALLEKTNPNYLKEVAAAARKEAPTRLGVVEVMNHLKHLALEEKRIKAEEEDTVMQLLAIIRGVELKSVVMHFGWRDELDRAIRKTQQTLETELLATDPLGRQILKLRREEEELLDTVWLATSPQQIRSLWQSVAELLAGEVTPLQQSALNTPPPEGSAE
jgi:hypothetical protein